MIKHTAIRKAVLTALKANIDDPNVVFFDGRPGFLDADTLPAVAVYLTDAECTGDYVDAELWSATLHVETFLKAASPDSALDDWVEGKIYPAMADVPELVKLTESMSVQGYDYQRDDEALTWGSADLKYSMSYFM